MLYNIRHTHGVESSGLVPKMSLGQPHVFAHAPCLLSAIGRDERWEIPWLTKPEQHCLALYRKVCQPLVCTTLAVN